MHPSVPVLIFVPVIVALVAWGLSTGAASASPAWPSPDTRSWTLLEYWLHRIVFHFEPEHGIGARVHWIIHGVHHEHPNDPMRLVMPPSVSVPLGAAVLRRSSTWRWAIAWSAA